MNLLQSVELEDLQLSDQFGIIIKTDIPKPETQRKEIKCRNIKGMDVEAFNLDLINSLSRATPSKAEELVVLYNETLISLLDKQAPEITKRVPDRPDSAWYGEERRRAEKVFRKSGLEAQGSKSDSCFYGVIPT